MTWNNFCTGYGCIGCSFLHRMDSLAQHSLSDKSLAVTTSIEWRTVMAQYRTVIWLESWLFTSGYWIKLNYPIHLLTTIFTYAVAPHPVSSSKNQSIVLSSCTFDLESHNVQIDK
ncbi:uncharacterized protein isoform X2 [Rhodnius prolixus]|uniref:uncharacterized protein isoform X2 n=1 Tax=Rhodnius prolixus TaxID=13249 RepID=UPI003D187E3E